MTGCFRFSRGVICDLRIEGEPEMIGVTGLHPIWSEDRQDWIPAGELRVGERLQRADGGTAVLLESRLRPQVEPVYNIEVEGDHCYRVGELGVLVHNVSAECDYCEKEKYQYQSLPPSGNSWTDFAVKKCNGKISGVDNPHGHHIVMKGDRYPENAKARQILCKYQINPYSDCRNLVISRNYCHSSRYAKKVLADLKKADQAGATAKNIETVLLALAAWHMSCGDEGKVDPRYDES